MDSKYIQLFQVYYISSKTKSIFETRHFFSQNPARSDSHFESTEKILIGFEISKKKWSFSNFKIALQNYYYIYNRDM